MAFTPLTEALRETLALFGESGVPKTTTEVADQLDLGRRSTYERLERLVDHGRLETKKVGANARVWWRPRPETEVAAPDWPAAARSLVDGVLDGAGVGVFVLDENFEVAWLNEATERYFGLDREEILGRDKRDLIEWHVAPLVEDGETFAETVLATYDNNTYTEQFECHVTAGDGREERWLEHRSKPIESGAYAGGRVELYYDVTDWKRSEWARQADRRQFESLVEAVEEYAIFMLDADGYVQTWNPGAERIKGYEADDILGEHFSTFYPGDARAAGVPEQNLSDAAEHGSVEDEGWRVRADGSRFWANVTITAIRDDDGALQGYAKVTRDMTDRREYEQELRRERDLTEQLLETAPMRFAVFRADGSIERMNSVARRQLGIDEAELSKFSIEGLDIYDADGYPMTAANHPALRAIETREPVSDCLVQHDGPNGNRRWVSLTATPLSDDGGTVERGVIAGRDVTALKQKEQQLERQRDELEQELAAVFERIDDGFYALDEEFRFEYVNDTAEAYLGKSEAELLGRNVWEAIEVPEDDPIIERFETAMETQEPTHFERYSNPLGIWAAVSVYPSSTGLSVYFRDITERKERDLELERYETIVETVTDGIVVVDADARIRTANDALVEMTGYPRERLVGSHASLIRPDDLDEEMTDVQASLDAGADTERVETMIQPANAEPFPSVTHFARITLDDGTAGRVGVVRDISDQVQRERELAESERRYRTLVENFPNGSVGLFDEDLTWNIVGGELLDDLGFSPDEIVGTTIYGRFPDELVDRIEPNFRAAFDGESNRFEIDLGDRDLLAETVPVRDAEDEVDAGMLVIQDITERKQRERELAQYETLFEESKDVNVIVEADGTFRYLTPSAENVFGYDPKELVGEVGFEFIHPDDREEALTEFAKMIESSGYEPEIEFRFEHKDGSWIVLEALARDLRDDPDVEGVVVYTRDVTERKERERALEESERRYRTLVENFPNGAVTLFDEDLQFLIAGGEAFEGLDVSTEELEGDTIHEHLSAEFIDTFEPRYRAVFEGQASEFEFEFNDQIRQFRVVPVRDESGAVFAGLTISQDVTQHREQERELQRQYEQLTALNNLNDTVRDITEAVIEQSTREEIEATVCERLAASDSYLFAWTGEVDTASETVTLGAEAGVEGYLDDATISVDPEDEHSEGPTGRALRTGEIQVTNDVHSDPRYEPWRDHAESYGVRSSAAIPIVHEDIVYGVLNVYSDRPHAFERQERDIVEQLGEVVGHAIAATERKQALVSDEATEIGFVVPDFIDVAGTSANVDGTITFERAVPAGDDVFLVYGTVDGDAIDSLEVFIEQLSSVEGVSIFDRGLDTAKFELRLSDFPLMSIVASHGGCLQQSRFENGDFHLTIRFPTTVDTRRIIDTIEEAYPTVTMLKRRQITQSHDTSARIQQTVTGDLTDRQRAALEVAVYSGYFEWPRDMTGQDVAESLDVSPATFSQHLRKAERKVFESIFPTPATA